MMTDRELDALIAERVMGWVKFYPTSPLWTLPNGAELPDGEFYPPRYSTDRNAAALVLERIGQNDKLRHAFCYAAAEILFPQKTGGYSWDDELWAIARGTPRQLMDAALAAVARPPETVPVTESQTQRDAKT